MEYVQRERIETGVLRFRLHIEGMEEYRWTWKVHECSRSGSTRWNRISMKLERKYDRLNELE